ncbi:MAG: plastocyanin/azurin family copper-binding protein [Balneolaceae bacterium]
MKKYLFSTIILALLLGLAACGGGEEAAESAEEVVDDGVRTIEITGIDDMKFVVSEPAEGIQTGGQIGQNVLLEAIVVKPGEEIRIRLSTVSNLPPTAMSHNFALLAQGTDVEAFARASITARDNDYIAPDFTDQVLVNTAMLGNGESDTITFTVPETPGEYDFICTFPGHYAGGMVGKLIVE